MIVVCDMGPIHYLLLIGAEDILPKLFSRVLAPVAVIAEMSHPSTPELVRLWASCPPQWLEINEPIDIEDIPALGKKGMRGAGEKAAIALAREAPRSSDPFSAAVTSGRAFGIRQDDSIKSKCVLLINTTRR